MEMQNKGFFGAIKLVAVILSLFLLVLTIKELKSYSYVGQGVQAVNTINVSGTGEAFAVPNIATFTFTVMDEASVVKTAQDSVTKTTNEILAYLKKQGIDDKDIRTTSYDIYPRYEYYGQTNVYPYPQGKQTLAGYDVSETIEVKVRKIADSGTLITGIGESGATNISGLSFSVENQDKVTAEARTKAINDAKSKAEELAKELGVKLVRIVNFSENGNYPMMYATKSMSAGMGGAAPDVASVPAGQNKFDSNVSVTYEIQ